MFRRLGGTPYIPLIKKRFRSGTEKTPYIPSKNKEKEI